MKKTNLYAFVLICTGLAFQHCTTSPSVKSPKCKLVEESNITYKELNQLLMQYNNGNTNTTVCDTAAYCGMDSKSLMKYIALYRDDIWSQTSPYFTNNDYNSRVLVDGIEGGTTFDAHDFDARFLDIPISELENYICVIKNSNTCNTANTIRFYYIKYDDNAPNQDYNHKHSLALVPVEKDMAAGTTIQEFVSNTVNSASATGNYIWVPKGGGGCATSTVANHNQLCPPFTGCIQNTMIFNADH